MADAFRGLTLRLGADARPVQSALSSISRSAGQAQSQLNKMNKALRFDGSNLAALRNSMDLAGDKARLTARSMQTVRTAIKQASAETAGFSDSSKYAGMKIGEVADRVRDVYSESQKLRSERTHANADLQHIYDGVKKVYAGTVKTGDATKIADKGVKAIQQALSRTYVEGNKAWEAIKKLVEQASGVQGLAEKFNLLNGDAEGLFSTFTRLHEASGTLRQDLNAMLKVEGLRALRTEAIAVDSALRQDVSDVTRLRAETASLATAPGLLKAVAYIQRIGEAAEAATAEARTMDAAFDAMPRSIEAARAKMLATMNAEEALTEKARAIEAAMRKIESSPGFDKMAASTRNVHLEFEKASHSATEMGVRVKNVESAIELFESELQEAKKAMNGLSESGKGVAELEARIERANEVLEVMKLRALAADQALDDAARNKHYSELRSQIAAVNTELAELKAKSSALNMFRNLGNGLREFGFGLYASVTPALMMVGRYAIQAAEDIDSAYRDMRKTVNGTEEEFEHLKQAALDYSTTHITSAEQILEIEAMGGQLGIAADSLESFATTVSNLDIATNIDADTAAEQLGKMASVIGISTDQYEKFGDALVRLGNNMPVMESDIMTLMTRFMGMGKVVGMEADEMLGWAAAASATGQGAEAAGSSMQRFISKMETAVVNGGDQLEKFAGVAGMSADEFADAFNTSASDAMYKFVMGLGDMQKSGESVNQMLGELKINNVRDKQLLEGFANQAANAQGKVNLLADALEMANTAYNGKSWSDATGAVERAGDAAREAARKSEGFSGALGMMRNQASVLANELASGAEPIVKDLAVAFGDLTDVFRAMPQEMKTGVVKALAALAAIGPISVAVGTTTRAVAGVAEGLVALQSRALSAGSSMRGFAKEMAASSGRMTTATKAVNGFARVLEGVGSINPAVFIGIAAYIAIVKSEFDKAMESGQKFADATIGLKNAVSAAHLDLYKAADDTSKLAGVQDTAAKSTDELIAKQAELADGIAKRSAESQASVSSLQSAKNVISELMNRTQRYGESAALNAQEQGRLKAAIDLVNDACGTHYKVVDALNGKIADERGEIQQTIGAIGDYIEQKKLQIRADSLMQDLQDLYPQQLEWYTKLIEAQRRMQDAQKGDDPFEQAAAAANLAEVAGRYREVTDCIEEMERSLGELSDEETKEAKTIGDLAEKSDLIKSGFAGNKEAFEGFKDELNKCGLTVEDFYDVNDETWSKIIAAYLNGEGTLSDILGSFGVNIRTLGDQFSSEFSRMGGDMGAFNERAENLAGGVEEFASKLSEAGISAQEFAKMGIGGFDSLFDAAEGDFGNLGRLIEALRAQGMDPVSVRIDDGQVTDAAGKVYQLGVTASETTGKKYTLTLMADPAPAQEAIAEAKEDAEEFGDSDPVVEVSEDGAAETETALDNVTDAANEAGATDPNISVGISDHASGTLSSIISLLNTIEQNKNKTITVTTYDKTIKSEEHQASGGILPHAAGAAYSRVIRSLPKHASGAINGIVTRPTMTNVGLTGEAGAEAIFHMRHAGGAIVPLTNRRYVRPFARAVASEMGAGGRTVNVTVNLDYKAGDDGARLARDVANRIEAYMNMGA